MKYYTPELLERFTSDDEPMALAAQDELEQRAEQYADHLKSISQKLPPRFRELQERFYLHDARVVWPFLPGFPPDAAPFHPEMFWKMFEETRHQPSGRVPSLMIALQLDAPPRELVILHYRGVQLEGMPLSPRRHSRFPSLEWQHDEVEVIPAEGTVEFLHSILFTEGFELKLQFADFDFATLKPMTVLSSWPSAQAG